jgi:hypothetical protein
MADGLYPHTHTHPEDLSVCLLADKPSRDPSALKV